MTRRRARPETLLAAAAAIVGGISVVSALTPSIASRSDFVRGVLPPGLPSAARFAALAFGLALVWLSRSLARRKRHAWQLAVALVVLTAGAHLAKGLDAEEATASLALFAALIRYRGRFDIPGDPAAVKPLLTAMFALAATGGFLGLYALHALSAPEDLEDLVSAVAGLLALRALYLWLRPWTEQVRTSIGERRRAHTLVDRYGHDSLAFFALRHDKSYFFAPSGEALIAYRVVAGCALVSGDPIGEPTEFKALLEEFRRVAHSRGWRVAVLGASGELLSLYRSIGLRIVKLGDEAVVRPQVFSLEGRSIRKVRQSVNRLTRAGYRVRVVPAAEAGPSLRATLASVSDECLGGWPERGFVMAMDELFAEPETVFAVAEDAAGEVGGFLHLVPAPAAGGYSLSAMRRRRSTPNGLMEFLIVETIDWARRENVPQIALNFCVFADVLRSGRGCSRHARMLRLALLGLDHVFQLRRLLTFSAKFAPEWQPRYVCCERLTDFPLVGLAYLQVESLLVPPRPWVRARRRKLAGLQH